MPQFENQLCNDPQNAITASKQFAQIIIGNVLHYASSSFDHAAIGKDTFHPDHRSARSSISELWRAADPFSDNASERAVAGLGRIEWQPLAVLCELRLEVNKRSPNFHNNNHRGRLELIDASET